MTERLLIRLFAFAPVRALLWWLPHLLLWPSVFDFLLAGIHSRAPFLGLPGVLLLLPGYLVSLPLTPLIAHARLGLEYEFILLRLTLTYLGQYVFVLVVLLAARRLRARRGRTRPKSTPAA